MAHLRITKQEACAHLGCLAEHLEVTMSSTLRWTRVRPVFLSLIVSSLTLTAALSLWPSLAAAQDVTGALQGTVVSPEGSPEPDVRVTVSGPHLQGVRETATDRDGFFQFLTLPPGIYVLRVGRIGSRPIQVTGVVVALGRTTDVAALTLTAQAIAMEPVEVIAPAISLDPVHTTMGSVIKAEDYAALPVDRDYKSIISILPHVNDSHRGDPVNVGGSTGWENQYNIDGVNVTDTRYASRATALPYNFVRSVNVRTGGYEARYGRALGTVVDAITYSGTNNFEANLFGLTQPGALAMDAKGAPVVREEGPVYHEYGGRISGPLVRDRVWYSAAFNPRVDKVDKELVGLGFYPDKTTATRYASKFTWRASSTSTIELSVFGDPSERKSVAALGPLLSTIANADPLLGQQDTGGTVASLHATLAPSRILLLQASLGKQWDRYTDEGATARGRSEQMYADAVEGLVGGGYRAAFREDRGRTSLTAQGTLMLRRHTLAAGAAYEDLATNSSFKTTGPGEIARIDSTLWFVNFMEYGGKVHNRSPAAFIQDTWRISDQLDVNIGLRWSQQRLVGASGRTAQSFSNEWQPRVGISLQFGRAGTQRLFGSYGRVYQTIPTCLAAMFYVDFTQTLSYYSSDPRQPGAVPDTVVDASWHEADYAKQIPGLETENFDEFTLGYERLMGQTILTVRGIRRNLRSAFEWGQDLSLPQIYVLGTPGKGDFSFLPPPKRQYTALELAAEGSWGRAAYRASYVLSRSWGNYTGLYDSDFAWFPDAGTSSTFFMPHQAKNSTGYLPNDHRHVFKLSTSYATPIHVSCGAVLGLESGSPINEFSPNPTVWSFFPSFVTPRGTVGRTQAVWNLDLRLAYDLPIMRGPATRLQLDLLHVGNPRGTVRVDEWHYNALDSNGNPASPNPNYRKPTAYQPPMALRLGMEVNF